MRYRRLPMDPRFRIPPPDGSRVIPVAEALESPVVADLRRGVPLLNQVQPHSCHDEAGRGLLLSVHDAVALSEELATQRQEYEDEREVSRRLIQRGRQIRAEHPGATPEQIAALIPESERQARPVRRGVLTVQDIWHAIAGTESEEGNLTRDLEPGRDAYWNALPHHPEAGYWLITLNGVARLIGLRLRRPGRPRAHWRNLDAFATIRQLPLDTPEQEAWAMERWRDTLRREAEDIATRGRLATYILPMETLLHQLRRLAKLAR